MSLSLSLSLSLTHTHTHIHTHTKASLVTLESLAKPYMYLTARVCNSPEKKVFLNKLFPKTLF